MKISIIFLSLFLFVIPNKKAEDPTSEEDSCSASLVKCEAEYNVTYTQRTELLFDFFPVPVEEVSCETGGEFTCPEVPCRIDSE